MNIEIYDNRKTGCREVWDNAPKPEPALYVPQAVSEKVKLRNGLIATCLSLAPLVLLIKRDYWWAGVWQPDGRYLSDGCAPNEKLDEPLPDFDIIAPHTEPRKPRTGYLEEGFMRVEPGYPVPAIELTPEVEAALAAKGLLP